MSKEKQKAVALYYDKAKSAPIVSAKGSGLVAEKIIQEAKENNIPIQQDNSLIEVLSQIELNQEIPTELYDVVSEILAFVYLMDKEYKTNQIYNNSKA